MLNGGVVWRDETGETTLELAAGARLVVG